ncbi:MAG: glutamine-hydrolyzing carbamoyl-phosphate synthase small subunit [Sporomusaceae bacterium]|jgi:carbamoyl-phosphate synthase small subunit|nr:glutamine-hydrolyzing carbamoyl-phosphate synthase small subunit [Sporomusaceae bacterium]
MRGKLVLEDGSSFSGQLVTECRAVGEVVFNTSAAGYQEILTDPSYCGQIVTMTYPLIGNYGTAAKFDQSQASCVGGLIINELCQTPSNWEMETSLSAYLQEKNIPCLTGVDTRAITRQVRSLGAMRGVIVPENFPQEELAKLLKEPVDQEVVQKVTTRAKYQLPAASGPHLVVVDLGIRKSILKGINKVGPVTVVPATTSAADILSLNPAGVIFSNGPGNPQAVAAVIATAKELIGKKPLFGFGLGHQVLALALGADTYKLKHGHRGANSPVQDVTSGRVYISEQNHGYAVCEKSLADLELVVTHRSLNDGTIEGLKHQTLPIYSVQHLPEMSPGFDDNSYFFHEFIPAVNKEAALKGVQ